MDKTPEELYAEREKRINDAIQLKVPDRVPVMPRFLFFPAMYAGITCEEMMYDYDKAYDVHKKAIVELAPDACLNPIGQTCQGPVLEKLGCEQAKWAGHGVGPDSAVQFVEKEYMEAGEYDAFINDPSDFVMRNIWPQIFTSLDPLKRLSPFYHSNYFGSAIPNLAAFGTPEVAHAFDILHDVGREVQKVMSYSKKFKEEMTQLGFPSMFGGFAQAPYDVIGNNFRGTRGIMLDLFRHPEKLLEVQEMIIPHIIKTAKDASRKSRNPRIFIPLVKGSDSFMSLEQFKKFYWPNLKTIMLALIDEGLVPCPFWQGDCTSRLETISDVPKGKCLYAFESTDIFRAKEILKDHVCIRGNVPAGMLCTGSPQEVEDYCRKLIDIVGKDGGFIMDSSSASEDIKPQNMKTMIDFTKEYGVYT